MSTFFGSVWWLIVTLGLLVTFHEFGHYWVARRCGVRVLRFSVGFGRALWKRSGRDGTEYRIAAIPLGGYVKMLDAREGEVPEAQRGEEFTGKSVWKRIAIVAAGPAFNLIFAIAAFWLMFMLGKPDSAPLLGTPPAQTLAAQAGLHAGDRIVSVDGRAVSTWSGALDALNEPLLDRAPATLGVKGRQGGMRSTTLHLDHIPADTDPANVFDRVGLSLYQPAVIGEVTPDSAAAAAHLKPGDRIVAINGKPVDDYTTLTAMVKSQAAISPRLEVGIERDHRAMTVPLTAKRQVAPGRTGPTWLIGVLVSPSTEKATLRYGPLRALGASLSNTWDKTATTFDMIGRMLTGRASTKNISGVITIAQVANTSAQMGFTWFLEFLGLISLSLAILNLLPIPILDGGHLLYYLIELVKGSPVSERVMVAGQFVGMALLAALVGLALYNDILRTVS